MSHDEYMREALKEAEFSVRSGSYPFACVVVNQAGEIVWRDHDRVNELMDPTAHSEVNAIRHLCQSLQTTDLSEFEFYTTSEPCPTCMSSLIKAKVQKVYYGVDTELDASLPISAKELVGRSNRTIVVVGGILAEECLQQRNQYGKH
jgi:tRNA(Arg) A34 adenosine deaminase TadA